MPKLLQINITANWGSTGKIAESIGVNAIHRDWESYIAYGRWMNPSISYLIKVGNKLDMYMHYSEQRIRDNEGLCSRGASRKLIKQIDVIKPDIIQLHNIHDHYLNYKLLFEYLYQTDIKVVWTFHDCWAFTGHCFHFVTKKCERWKTGCYDCPLKNEYPKTFLDGSIRNYALKKQLFQNFKNLTIVAVSDWIGDLIEQSFLKDKRIEIIKNGVDLRSYKQSSPKLSAMDGKFHIIAVSNIWNKDKGLFDIFKIKELLSSNYEITIVGLSAQQIKSLKVGIKGIQRTQSIQELIQLYSEADVLINPTYADTFPTVNIEALACGTPVITYKTGGSSEAIDDKTGVVIPQGDIKSFAKAIMWMSANPLSSENCRKRAESLFDKNLCFDKYIDLYNALIVGK